MTPQERDLILAVAQRLRDTTLTEKDHEAERLIHSEIGSQPDALYLLAQAVIVQEQGLRHAQERIQQLETQRSGGFLSNLFGGAPPSASYAASSAPGGSAAGSFLRSAAATAAGVVGAQLIYDGLRHMFGGSSFAPPGFAPVVSEQNNPNEQRSSLGGGGSWEEDDDSMPNDDSLAGGDDFDTDSGDYDDSDSF